MFPVSKALNSICKRQKAKQMRNTEPQVPAFYPPSPLFSQDLEIDGLSMVSAYNQILSLMWHYFSIPRQFGGDRAGTPRWSLSMVVGEKV